VTSPVSVDLRSERAITELSKGLVYLIKAHVVSIEESKDVSSDERGRNVDVNDRRGMDLAVVRRPVKGESPFYKRVRGVEVGADVTRRRFTAMLVPDAEWYEGRASIVFETCRDWGWDPSGGPGALRLLLHGASSIWYWLGSITSASTLTSTSSGTYTQPFSNDGLLDSKTLRDNARNFFSVIVGWRNRSGILVVFEGVDETTCQRCGLHTIEVNPRHAVGLNGGPQWDSRREVEGGVWDDRGVSMTVLVLFSAPSTLSEILGSG
jgi:hypothetical protein